MLLGAGQSGAFSAELIDDVVLRYWRGIPEQLMRRLHHRAFVLLVLQPVAYARITYQAAPLMLSRTRRRHGTRHKLDIQKYKGRAGRQIAMSFERAA
jgi:hypothetical protein